MCQSSIRFDSLQPKELLLSYCYQKKLLNSKQEGHRTQVPNSATQGKKKGKKRKPNLWGRLEIDHSCRDAVHYINRFTSYVIFELWSEPILWKHVITEYYASRKLSSREMGWVVLQSSKQKLVAINFVFSIVSSWYHFVFVLNQV